LIHTVTSMNFRDILNAASERLIKLKGQTLDIFYIIKPPDVEYALHLAKVISKLSPAVANMIEFLIVKELNKIDWKCEGLWIRQDPDFPDVFFDGVIRPKPGFEIKTWFPMATGITARFKDSVLYFWNDQIYVCLITWLPEFILYGKPKILDVWVGSAKSLAESRDSHYHNPPDYLIFEPEDTSSRTKNLQQSNTNGYKFQGTKEQYEEAKLIVESWGKDGKSYLPTKEYQHKLRSLFRRYPYRLDTNFSKLDRIQHEDLEKFKKRILNTFFGGYKLVDLSKLIMKDKEVLEDLLKNHDSVKSDSSANGD
jgi:hypothetical protein